MVLMLNLLCSFYQHKTFIKISRFRFIISLNEYNYIMEYQVFIEQISNKARGKVYWLLPFTILGVFPHEPEH